MKKGSETTTNNTVKLIVRCIWAAIAVVATICTLTDHVGSLGGDYRPVTLFFTSWSVWVTTFAAIPSLVCTIRKDERTPQWVSVVKFCAIIMVIPTFFISAFVIPDTIWMSSYWTFESTFKHFLLPIITIVDALMHDEKGSYKVYYPFISLVMPLIYWTAIISRFCTARVSSGGSVPVDLWDQYYPYIFTNIDNGYTLFGIIILLVAIMLVLIAVGYGFYFVNRDYKK